MAYSRERLGRIIELVDGHVQRTRRALDDAFAGPPLGAQTVDDDTFRQFFEQKVMENPNFPLALPFVTGGPALLARYERIVGLNHA